MSITMDAFSAGLLGMNRGSQTVTAAASNLARQTGGVDGVGKMSASQDMAGDLVNLRVGQNNFDASAKVMQAADDMVGTLLDVMA